MKTELVNFITIGDNKVIATVAIHKLFRKTTYQMYYSQQEFIKNKSKLWYRLDYTTLSNYKIPYSKINPYNLDIPDYNMEKQLSEWYYNKGEI